MSICLPSLIFGHISRKKSFRYKPLAFVCQRNPYSSPSVNKGDKRPRILVIGSGWGGYRCAMDLEKEKFRVQLISPRNHFLFTPLLPSTAVGTLEFRAIQEPARVIPGVEYFQASLTDLDLTTGTAHCIDAFAKAHKFKLEYDAIVLAPGSETNTFGVRGVTENHNVFFLKQLQDARGIRNRLIECFERASSPSISELSPKAANDDDNSTIGEAERERLLTFVVVGGGPTSVEFAAELYDFLKSDVSRWYPELHQKVRVILVEASGHILGSFHSSLVGYVESLFKSRRIEVITGTAVREIDEHVAILSDGRRIPFGLMVWSTGVKQIDLIRRLGEEKVDLAENRHSSFLFSLSAMSNGRLKIDSRLRVVFDGTESTFHEKFGEKIREKIPAVFAIGDCAANEKKPLPMLAQVASQQGIYLAAALNKHGLVEMWKCGGSAIGAPKTRIPDFNYAHLGAMASIGEWKGVYDSTHLGTDSQDISGPPVKGFLAFLLWRAAYWTKQVSLNNKILILMHWFKSAVFGRDISRF